MSDFYRLAETDYKGFDGYQHRILWNVKAIAKKSNANGYIVQRVVAKTTCSEIRMEDRPYFEAWRVTEGSTKNTNYDDEFCARYLDAPGEVTYHTKVFWIDKEDNLFSVIDRWKPGKVQMASKLPSAYEFPEIEGKRPVCERLFHWNSEDYK